MMHAISCKKVEVLLSKHLEGRNLGIIVYLVFLSRNFILSAVVLCLHKPVVVILSSHLLSDTHDFAELLNDLVLCSAVSAD
jgi:hypothetical protein